MVLPNVFTNRRITNDQEIALIPGLSDLWAETTGDPRVVVAILDGPVDRSHPALAGARLETVEAAVPAVARHGGPATRHGTAVASLIFGRHAPDNPVRGMAPGCRGLVVPIFDEADGSGETRAGEPFRPVCSQLDLARAILLAVEHGAQIINISAGQPLPASAAYPVMAAAVDRAVRRGILVVAAAGNDGCACEHIPAALPGVLAVGAMDSRGRPIASSNWASSYRSAGLLAPGTGLLAARAGGGSSVVGGTSFATAIVAGAAALLASLALRHGQSLNGTRIREILLDSTHGCLEDTISCRRWLAGRLDLLGSRHLLLTRDLRMSDDIPLHASSAGEGWPTVDAAVDMPSGSTLPSALAPGSSPSPPSATAHVAAPARHLTPSEGCDCASCRAKAEAKPKSEGCDCASCRAKAEPGKPALVFALGQIGHDLISEARRDSIQQHMGGTGANPFEPSQILGYLKDNPWEAGSIVWTLNIDQTPVYAIMPAGPFAAKVYDLLREFLDDQINGRVEMVSIPGRLAGPVRLFNGQVVPAVIPEPRGMYSWTTGALVEAVVAKSTPQDGKAEAVREFLQKVYHELRNLGLTAEERAVNYSATNAFQVEKVFESAIKESLALDTIEVERSPLCRPDSDCWDVKIHFFYPDRQVQTVRKVFRFTVDVSDVVPVTVGPARSWFVR
jgi:cyanobactin maturation PatA/PatG family protease